ncbi:MAG: hypothetical protein AB7H71_12855 [Alphaproteobacteria bacterium]
MRRLAFAVATVLPLVAAGVAVAQPAQLTNNQMDKVSAGFLEIDQSNTSATILSMFFRTSLFVTTPNTITCTTCYLVINSPVFSVASQFGPGVPLATFPP